jgi:outer membrane protein OmpA-like peptidoglycan-associated protein
MAEMAMPARTLATAALMGLLVSGCSHTLVVLVPDPYGKLGRVSVTTAGGQEVLSKSGESTQTSSTAAAPDSPIVLSDEQIREMFASALANEPAAPERYVLYFDSDSAELPVESAPLIHKIHRAIQARGPCDVSVIGHTDRDGIASRNETLSLRRAKATAKALASAGVSEDCMDIRYYGERDPAVPTPAGVSEPRNRRVEVEIR